jgi:hypothetical protein
LHCTAGRSSVDALDARAGSRRVTSQGAASVFAMHRASRTTGEIADYLLWLGSLVLALDEYRSFNPERPRLRTFTIRAADA